MRELFLLLLVALLGGQASAQNTPTVDEIIAKNIQARGGMNKLAGIKTIRATYSTEEDGKPVRLVELHKRPNKLRRNLSLGGNTVVFDGPLVNYKEKGSTVELLGKEKLNGKDVYNLKLTLKEGQVRNIYLDARSFLEVKETGFYQQAGKRVDFATVFKDYRPVQGIMFPFVTDQKAGDEENQSTYLKKVELNVPIADSVFSMSATPPKQNAK
jgi:outer membrane lipoprotein-sorting protein